LRGFRAPLAALIIALLLFGAVIATRPADPTPPPPGVTMVTATARPVVLTPAPTIPIQQIDTTTLNEALVGSPKKINPLLAGYNRVDQDLSALIFEGLMTTDATGSSVPDLAAAPPTISSDGLVYAVSLRTDVLWQDGVPFSAADVLFTVHLMQDAAFPGTPDLHTFWQTVEIDALDDHTVRFQLAQPLAAFTDDLRIGILPEHALRGTSAAGLLTHPFNLSPIGTGPYQFDAWVGNSSQITGVRLQVAPTYRQRPEGKTGYALEHLAFHFYPSADAAVNAFQRGEVFSIGELPPETLQQIGAITELQTYFQHRPTFGVVIYNWQNPNTPFFHDLRLRQALASAIDRTTLVSRYLAGRALPAYSPILPDSWAYDPNTNCPQLMPYDIAQAKDDMAHIQISAPSATAVATSNATASAITSGATDLAPVATAASTATTAAPAPATSSGGASKFHFQLLVSNDPAVVNMAKDMITAWASIGITVQISVTDAQSLNPRLIKGNFDAALVELNLAPSADPDPYSLWRLLPANGGLNFGGMNERGLNDLLEQARRESNNGVHRAELYRQYQQLFCERAAALLLYNPVYAYGADRRINGVQLGFIAQPSDRFRTLRDWKFVAG